MLAPCFLIVKITWFFTLHLPNIPSIQADLHSSVCSIFYKSVTVNRSNSGFQSNLPKCQRMRSIQIDISHYNQCEHKSFRFQVDFHQPIALIILPHSHRSPASGSVSTSENQLDMHHTCMSCEILACQI